MFTLVIEAGHWWAAAAEIAKDLHFTGVLAVAMGAAYVVLAARRAEPHTVGLGHLHSLRLVARRLTPALIDMGCEVDINGDQTRRACQHVSST